MNLTELEGLIVDTIKKKKKRHTPSICSIRDAEGALRHEIKHRGMNFQKLRGRSNRPNPIFFLTIYNIVIRYKLKPVWMLECHLQLQVRGPIGYRWSYRREVLKMMSTATCSSCFSYRSSRRGMPGLVFIMLLLFLSTITWPFFILANLPNLWGRETRSKSPL